MSLLPKATSVPKTLSPKQTDRQMQDLGGFFDNAILHADCRFMDNRIQKTIKILRANLHLNLSCEAIARTVNLSPSRLRCLFGEATGLPLAKYVKHLRLEAACQLLATEYLTVKEVMVKTGFKDPSHFNRNFKKAYRVTPSQHRNLSKCTGSQSFPGFAA